MLSLNNTIYEDDIAVIYRTAIPILFSLTVDGALAKKWKPWKMKHLELRSDATMVYRGDKAPNHIQGKLDVKDITISEVIMKVDTTNPLINKEIGINCQCLKDGIKTYFRCIFDEKELEKFRNALQTISNVKYEKASSNLSIRQSQANHNQSTFRKAITKEWDRANIRDRTELVTMRRGAFKWLPVLCENDLVHGSWWFVVGSVYIVIAGAIVLANNYNTSILGEDDEVSIDDFTFRTSWALVILSGLFFTLGSMAFVRATHFDPPMKAIFSSKHVATDELLASWLFFFGTLPAIPYVLLFLVVAKHNYTRVILVIGLLVALLFVYAVLLFVFACYPNEVNELERPHRVLDFSLIAFKYCCTEKYLRKHLSNDWLAGCWLFLLASIIFTVGATFLFFQALFDNNTTTTFIMGTGFSDSLIFAIGSMYFVSGSYPEQDVNSDMLTASLTSLNRIEEDM